jgi:2-polyprenyl-3-methyl-5-hydroxy-6-metoxy-1,4-benzoquinol methylase
MVFEEPKVEWVLNPVRTYGIPKAPATIEQQLFFREHNLAGALERVITADHITRYAYARHISKGLRVCDAGCANGYGTAEIAQEAAYVIGFDRDYQSLQEAYKRYASSTCSFVAADFNAISFPPASFDLVVAFEVVEHVQEPLTFLGNLLQLVVPNGRLLFSTPNRAINSPDWHVPYNPFHVREWDLEELQAFLEQLSLHYTIYGEVPKYLPEMDESVMTPEEDIIFEAEGYLLRRSMLEKSDNFIVEITR